MGLPRKLLGEGEHVEVHVRTHAKRLIGPAVLLILLAAAVGFGCALVPPDGTPIGQYVVIIVGLVLFCWWCLVPFLRWRTTTYSITNRRLITRTGILNKTGKDLPLIRINDVSYDRSLLDRMLGCGTLNIQTAGENSTISLDDVPDVERIHVIMSELLFGEVHGDRRD
ncbi:PH domain-containing protein [Microlunatus sp. Gsoil 973]|uniref:PH domain-containing protein n=1 Tax=Microlunatus sp. Gsoil 973 TaxID=2672569 RepID=UPI0012B4CC09|nr:PH domain-containing protein [Microlunatus sp. Gsoil 973]QGN35220.1 PH domain-containing protein [Microlunatus sp. Gsoil 973]